ncbi:MAG: AAA family ATPase, partial [Candidatus Eisenbacteria bacterium]|nr:AAA family ATPase [Candidatus Eisenbacteria bacterium]
MFETALGLRENPFVAGHQPRFVYPSREHQEALAHLRFGIENREPFVLITGEVGTGKTTAIYDALNGWGARTVVALITNSSLTRAELIEEIALRFGLALPPGTSKPQALVQLERHLREVRTRGELAILLLDEAQNLDRELLEEIRLLSNLEEQGAKLLQIFLVGQPELEEKLTRPELRQLKQRIVVHYRLKPMGADETEHYIRHRVAVAGGNSYELFPVETCRAIFALTHGIPREINTVSGQAMLNAYVDDSRVVRPDHVHSVARENEFRSVIDVHGLRGGGGEASPSPYSRAQDAHQPSPPVANANVPDALSPRVEPETIIPAAEPPRRPMDAPATEWRSAPRAEPQPEFTREWPNEPAAEPRRDPAPLAASSPAEDADIAMPAWLEDAIARRRAEGPAAEPEAIEEPVLLAAAAPARMPRIVPHPSGEAGRARDDDSLPPRLREKLDRGENETPRERSALPWV